MIENRRLRRIHSNIIDEVQQLKAQVMHLKNELHVSNTRLVEHGLPLAPPALPAPQRNASATELDGLDADTATSLLALNPAAAAQAAADLTSALTTAVSTSQLSTASARTSPPPLLEQRPTSTASQQVRGSRLDQTTAVHEYERGVACRPLMR